MEKMTRVQMFNAIKAEVADKPAMVEFLDHQIELCQKKSANRKPSAKQVENEAIKNSIVEILRNAEPMTVTDITKLLAGDFSNQKVSALITQLRNDAVVERFTDKRKTYFKLK